MSLKNREPRRGRPRASRQTPAQLRRQLAYVHSLALTARRENLETYSRRSFIKAIKFYRIAANLAEKLGENNRARGFKQQADYFDTILEARGKF